MEDMKRVMDEGGMYRAKFRRKGRKKGNAGNSGAKSQGIMRGSEPIVT